MDNLNLNSDSARNQAAGSAGGLKGSKISQDMMRGLWHTFDINQVKRGLQEAMRKIITLPETNIAPENGPSQKETRIPSIHFQVLLLLV